MKNRIIATVLMLALAACSTVTPAQISTVASLVNAGLQTYGAYQSKNPVAIANSASADLSGMAAIANAYPGLTPQAANLAQGAANAALAAKIVAALPAKPMNGGTVAFLQAGAAQLSNPATVTALLTPAS